MNQIIKKADCNLEIWQKAGVPAAIWFAMKSSLYPGAKDESILMAWEYCNAAKLDPLQKPVHLVPMWIMDKKTNKGEMRDVVMPGIALYRTQASRSGMYAGMTEPEFGRDITEKLGSLEITYPEWCKITVKKIVNGQIVDFTAKEYWIENYANSGKDKATGKIKLEPNEMWRKRKYGQLAKCTEAQALRKAFPDHVSHAPTAEEMEGKTIETDFKDVSASARPTIQYASKADALADLLADEEPDTQITIEEAKVKFEEIKTEKAVLDKTATIEHLKQLVDTHNIPNSTIEAWFAKANANSYNDFTMEQLESCVAYVNAKAEKLRNEKLRDKSLSKSN